MTVHRHQLPFGAELQEDGRVRFRLWAPATREVSLVLEGDVTLAMPAVAGGWFELTTAEARAGSRYRYVTDKGIPVPDPASRFQPEDVHGPSEVIDPTAYVWRTQDWRGRPWHEAVIYELHVGAFSPEGTFAAVTRRFDHIVALGATAIELMPVADFPGKRNWGYDGVLWYAPDSTYGRPEELKALVDQAHARGLMVFLDVVHNHLGPEGNYLHLYAPQMFTKKRTPWGEAVNFAERPVRDFVIHNALYWLEEFQLDGLRMDAVDHIVDRSDEQIIIELARAIRRVGPRDREIHLILENDDNAAAYLTRAPGGRADLHTAQWNDDCHHALQHLVTGDQGGYYDDFTAAPMARLGRVLVEGFAYQGEPSPSHRQKRRGQSTKGLPLVAFVNYLQSHDQVGNRVLGERIRLGGPDAAAKAAVAILALCPSPVMVFMGEEWGAVTPFCFFCDLPKDLGTEVANGRRRELRRFSHSAAVSTQRQMLLPNEPATFARSKLDWHELDRPGHQAWLELYRSLFTIRRELVTWRCAGVGAHQGRVQLFGARGLAAGWRLDDGATLSVVANLGAVPCDLDFSPAGERLFCVGSLSDDILGPWSVAWFLEPAIGMKR
jgi:malto-oligosyltrehalose trehalohydrolase